MTTARISDENRGLELSVVGYQFGDPIQAAVGVGDERWLDMRIKATDGMQTWERVDACLTDVELRGLVTSMRNLAEGVAPSASFEGDEPSFQLQARRSDDRIDLEVFFRLDLHPLGPDEREPYLDAKVLRFALSTQDVDLFARALEDELLRLRRT